MHRTELEQYIVETYSTEADHPWIKYPNNAVFRHIGNGKWFTLLMDVPKEKLGAPGDGMLSIINVKCDPVMIGGLLAEPGFFPAYHMSKDNWITIALDGSADAEKIKILLDMSYNHTNVTAKRRGPRPNE